MKKFRITSKWGKGQMLFTIHEGKIVSGICIGYKAPIISEIEYHSNIAETHLRLSSGNTIWPNEDECFKSQRALIKHLKS